MESDKSTEDNLTSSVIEVIEQREMQRQEQEYKKFCNLFASQPEDFQRILKDGFFADIELQPNRWIHLGLDLIDSRKAFGTIQLFNGSPGPDFKAFLPYPVFLMGAEVFLKGMWLHHHKECGVLRSDDYIEKETRERLAKEIKSISPEHNLIEIISAVQKLERYQQDEFSKRFLKIISAITRKYYSPFFNDKMKWAAARYPRRFYKDSEKESASESLFSFPEHRHISRLFHEMAERIETLWEVN